MTQSSLTSSQSKRRNKSFFNRYLNQSSNFVNEKFEGLSPIQKVIITVYSTFAITTFVTLIIFILSTGTKI
jgi:hypothetical protein